MPDKTTPLVRIDTFGKLTVYGKLENLNPSGSVKYRTVTRMLSDAIRSGELREGMRLIEVTSGNTGIALAFKGRELGYPVTIVTSQLATDETKRMIRGYGAEIIESDSYQGGMRLIERRMREEPKAWYWTRQTTNPSSLQANMELGREILGQFRKQFGGKIDAYMGSTSGGSTLTGVARALKEANPETRVYRVAPKGDFKNAGVEDITDEYIPLLPLFDKTVVDEVITVAEAEAIAAARELADKYKIAVGISAGADFAAAKSIAGSATGNCVLVFPDSADRYPVLTNG